MASLTEHQLHALNAYCALAIERPSLFAGRLLRPIVKDRELLAAYAADNKVVLGVAAETPYVLFVVDLVESRLPDGGIHRHPYLRVVSLAQLRGGVNVVILATIENPSLGPTGSIVLVDQERHALGTSQTEIPRGFGEAGVSGEVNALRELEDETGFVGDHAYLLGNTATDSGLTDSSISFYHVPIVRSVPRQTEVGEAITRVHLATPQELWNLIRSGVVRDSFTLQALAFFEMRKE
jgi:ADP-ribose pyrophosphatase